VFAAALGNWGCELTSTTLAQPDDALIVEGFVIAGLDPAGSTVARVFAHGTLSVPVLESVEVTGPDGQTTRLSEVDRNRCLILQENIFEPEQLGACYEAELPSSITGSARVELSVRAADGRVATGVTTVPADFEILAPVPAGRSCWAPADTRFDIIWTESPGAWAYPTEMEVRGLSEALAGVDPNYSNLFDPFVLFGLAISATDTVISFPNEYGLFDRFDGDDLFKRSLIEIQDGLPAQTDARITLAAADRNYINWERGGNFNPSGPVRVPSVRGDGFGVFGSMVVKTIAISVGDSIAGRPACIR